MERSLALNRRVRVDELEVPVFDLLRPASHILIALLCTTGCSVHRAPAPSGTGSDFEAGAIGTAGSGAAEDGDMQLGAVPASAQLDSTHAMGTEAGGDGLVLEDAGLPTVEGDAIEQEPPAPERYQGSCETDGDCALDESCVQTQGLRGAASYCAQVCAADAECAAGPDGSHGMCAMSSDGAGRCHLPCDALSSDSCPDGMLCRDTLIFLSEGSCVFEG